MSGPGVRLTVRVLGPLEVRRGDRVLTAQELGGPKQRQILEILLLQLGTPVSKDRLVELLWGDRPPAAALQNLESYVSVLRRGLQPGAGRKGPLRTANGGYVMDAEAVDLDLRRFELAVERAGHSRPHEAYALWCEALERASAPLLENELRCEWAERQREVHAALVLEARVSAAECALGLRLHHEAVRHARAALVEDVLQERAWTVLILGLEGSGRPVEGLQAYEQCRRTLARELGCAPSTALQDSYARMLRATAETSGDLGQVLTALLVLHGQLGDADWMPGTRAPLARQEAASVLQAFLGRSVGAAA
ncbi:BTAD domain-containing putative transcriptional regulator [uncultured Kocuria sp.]|uniref:AfsR/SARP family transcriptional regulator n=1 Tax=uncultured Kocuria sp. TaxID=259305 RepID=UPI002604D6D6|nr:BTAD domain-containing putative transcriptional regulator [uncultured Kocuria sp.]